uniref:Photosystem II protein L n=1 Tax=Iochroma lehmannii TaxID=362362 RepID=A0A166QBI7_9SOLA|nr:photosystem II protein L [Iochroma lehmannii]ANA56701.1 photosystem II protein L [Iochroma lehmannii]
MGVITHFCTCCFIFQLFLQLRKRKRINKILLAHSEGSHNLIIHDCLCL